MNRVPCLFDMICKLEADYGNVFGVNERTLFRRCDFTWEVPFMFDMFYNVTLLYKLMTVVLSRLFVAGSSLWTITPSIML